MYLTEYLVTVYTQKYKCDYQALCSVREWGTEKPENVFPVNKAVCMKYKVLLFEACYQIKFLQIAQTKTVTGQSDTQ